MLNIWLISLLSFFMPPEDKGRWYELSAEDFFALEKVNQAIRPEKFEGALLEAAVFHASNLKRSLYKKPTFSYHPSLRAAARQHSNYMRETGQLSHQNRSEKSLRNPRARIEYFNGQFNEVGENLARLSLFQLGPRGQFFQTPDGALVNERREPLKTYTYAELAHEVVIGWMKSRAHRENLMGDYSYLAVGLSEVSQASSGLAEVYFTQNFGNP